MTHRADMAERCPAAMTVAEVVEQLPGVSERRVRMIAQQTGEYRAAGRVMLFTSEDVEALGDGS